MRRFSVFATLIVLTLLVAMGMGVGLAAADEPDDDTHSILDRTDAENASESQVQTVENWATDEQLEALNDSERERVELWLEDAPELETVKPDEFDVEFDDNTWITDYTLEDGTATITLVSDRERTVTVSDALAGVDQEGAVQVPSQDYEISEGETTISMDVREVRGSSTVGVTVRGTTVRLSTEMEEPEQTTEENPFRHFGGESGLFSGIIMTVGLAGLGTVHVLRSEESGVIEA